MGKKSDISEGINMRTRNTQWKRIRVWREMSLKGLVSAVQEKSTPKRQWVSSQFIENNTAPLAVNCFPTQMIQKSSECTLSAMDSRNEKEKETREAKSKPVVMGVEEKVGK